MNNTIFVGLDVHKETIAIAYAKGNNRDVESLGIIMNESMAITKLVKKLEAKGATLLFCYEAGPCGYGLQRQISSLGHTCVVVAPGLVPSKPGDRIKTDRRDAEKLARHFRNGDLSPVWVPDIDHEAMRDLVRARQSAKEDLHRNRQRLLKFLLRLGVRSPERARSWGARHKKWLQSLKLDNEIQQIVLTEHLNAIRECEGRVERFEKEIQIQSSEGETHQAITTALQALKGIALVSAATIIAEAGDLTRFDKPQQLMAYAGLIPSEDSSGGTKKRGAITKCGNSHLRRVIVEAAWHYRHRPAVGVNLGKRQERVSEDIKQISWKAQQRLNSKYRRMMGRGKPKQKAITAVARELLGFIWAIGQEVKYGNQSIEVA